MEGWISIHRKIADNPLWLSEPFTKSQAWIDLIILATHKSSYLLIRGIKIDLKRGQVGWSEPRLAKRWRWSRSKVRGFLKLLEKEQQIVIEKSNVTQVLTLVNYDEYQQEKTANRTAERQQTVQQKDPNNNVNNVNNKIYAQFEGFWNQYHQITTLPKTDRLAAHKYWNKLSQGEQVKAIDMIQPYFDSLRDKDYCKIARTYLSGKAFDDQFTNTAHPNGQQSPVANEPVYDDD